MCAGLPLPSSQLAESHRKTSRQRCTSFTARAKSPSCSLAFALRSNALMLRLSKASAHSQCAMASCANAIIQSRTCTVKQQRGHGGHTRIHVLCCDVSSGLRSVGHPHLVVAQRQVAQRGIEAQLQFQVPVQVQRGDREEAGREAGREFGRGRGGQGQLRQRRLVVPQRRLQPSPSSRLAEQRVASLVVLRRGEGASVLAHGRTRVSE